MTCFIGSSKKKLHGLHIFFVSELREYTQITTHFGLLCLLFNHYSDQY